MRIAYLSTNRIDNKKKKRPLTSYKNKIDHNGRNLNRRQPVYEGQYFIWNSNQFSNSETTEPSGIH